MPKTSWIGSFSDESSAMYIAAALCQINRARDCDPEGIAQAIAPLVHARMLDHSLLEWAANQAVCGCWPNPSILVLERKIKANQTSLEQMMAVAPKEMANPYRPGTQLHHMWCRQRPVSVDVTEGVEHVWKLSSRS